MYREGKAVDFRVSARRVLAAAKAFLANAINIQGLPPKSIALDRYAPYHRAVRERRSDEVLPIDTTLRSSRNVNKLIGQDHRRIKSGVKVMLGF